MPYITWLALRDFIHEWKMSVCLFMGLAAVLAPILVLFGVKFGVINTLKSRLQEDPTALEIRCVGSGKFGQEWFAAIAEREDVSFLIPRTRAIAATMRIVPETSGGRIAILTDLIPSRAGDPLLRDSPPHGLHEIVLSLPAAEKMEVSKGDKVLGIVNRILEGRSEILKIQLDVRDVLPLHRLDWEAALVSLELLLAIEDFRDGYAVPALGFVKNNFPPIPRYHAGFRLYARSINDVGNLRDFLSNQNVEVRTKAAEIEMIQSLERNLSTVFWIIAVIGVIGYLLSLGVSILANVERKTKELCVLRLVGFSTVNIVSFPVLHACFVALLGSGMAIIIYCIVQSVLNNLFAGRVETGEFICLLAPRHYTASLCLTVAFSVLASAAGGYKAAKINPVRGFQDV